jgi:hypothetical protein
VGVGELATLRAGTCSAEGTNMGICSSFAGGAGAVVARWGKENGNTPSSKRTWREVRTRRETGRSTGSHGGRTDYRGRCRPQSDALVCGVRWMRCLDNRVIQRHKQDRSLGRRQAEAQEACMTCWRGRDAGSEGKLRCSLLQPRTAVAWTRETTKYERYR